jgi:hydrogenase maturation protease
VLVIGVGNAYRNDDAVGLVVGRLIRELHIDGLTVVEATGEGTNLIDTWRDAGLVILVDAVRSGAEPGTIHRFDARAQKLPTRLFSHSTHSFSVAEAIELARKLDRLPLSLIVYGIEGKDFCVGNKLSEEIEKAAHHAAQRVIQDVRAWA